MLQNWNLPGPLVTNPDVVCVLEIDKGCHEGDAAEFTAEYTFSVGGEDRDWGTCYLFVTEKISKIGCPWALRKALLRTLLILSVAVQTLCAALDSMSWASFDRRTKYLAWLGRGLIVSLWIWLGEVEFVVGWIHVMDLPLRVLEMRMGL